MADISSQLSLPHSKKIATNRLLKAAMTEHLCAYNEIDMSQSGRPTPELIELYRVWGKGVPGIIVTGNIMIDREHLEHRTNAIIDDRSDNFVPDYAKVAEAAKANGSLIIGQLSHVGRQCSSDIQKHPVAASAVQLPANAMHSYEMPTALEQAGIDKIIGQFAHAAHVLYKAGFDGVQLHAAHGYLLSGFLSNRTNKRLDKYGGSLDNRARLLLEVIAAVKERIGDSDFSISVKLNSQDFVDEGFTEADSAAVCHMLDQAQVDFVEVSGGSYEKSGFNHSLQRESTIKREGYFIALCEQLRPQMRNMRLVCTGGFRTVGAMNAALASGALDMCGIGRPLCAEPLLVDHMMKGQTEAAKASLLPNVPGLPIIAGTLQLQQIGRCQPILDLSQPAHVAGFITKLKAMHAS
ncbi:hypothetical protein E5Q_01163 [Mixia osmundae IAM 14324]|uniref:NADH:flavin oxidoreductase/NADH oxidase N-terminal domain-containing protein n=1 Tax=Mixia osmundae (strain CBS 9802 / IAM 14324 / JCM 22182 / KY 12970) TaxID=764103 RepID=G7DVA1_MIXOS|nr:hypothetical protein E5Q_01163 [Mixia osmundae IAM 14324]